ncbi:excisionase [Ruminococcus sp.]|uniref:excisionase n=1 Tax=Ruminococcus sp. TaxID=41978 RepID=UPI002E80F372|nr:excisionase [Ruminococcus sp.]MEE3492721.1 excisionase [Ruminococcus sp.]
MNEIEIPIWKKLLLTPKEASAYSNIGINRIVEMLRSPYCTFAIRKESRTLVKRKEFEEYISQTDTIDL